MIPDVPRTAHNVLNDKVIRMSTHNKGRDIWFTTIHDQLLGSLSIWGIYLIFKSLSSHGRFGEMEVSVRFLAANFVVTQHSPVSSLGCGRLRET